MSSGISANVTRLRFMRNAENEEDKQKDNWSRVFVIEPDWCTLTREEFNAIPTNQLPTLFKQTHVLPKASIVSQHRRSYKGFNPAVEKYQKQVRGVQKKLEGNNEE